MSECVCVCEFGAYTTAYGSRCYSIALTLSAYTRSYEKLLEWTGVDIGSPTVLL